MDTFFKKSGLATNREHVIIKEELIIPDSDEEVDVEDVEKSIHPRIPKDTIQSNPAVKLISEEKQNSKRKKSNKVVKSRNQRRCRCSDCGKTYKYQRGLLEHRKVHHSSQIQSSINDTQSNHPSYKHICSNCGSGFRYMSRKLQHEQSCGQEARFKCDHCSYTAHYKSNLTSHVREKHSEYREKCPNCKRIFTNQRSFKRHMKIYCNKPKSFECDECGKKYYRKDQIIQHFDHLLCEYAKEVGTDDNVGSGCCNWSRVCKYCGVILDQYERMKDHLERCELADPKVRRPSEVDRQPDIDAALKNLSNTYCVKCKTTKPVKYGVGSCTNCKTRLKFHCTSCSKTYNNSYTLRCHLKTNHLERVTFYRCDHCRRSYKNRKHLVQHMKTHYSHEQTINIFKCFNCGKMYDRKMSLKKHEVSCVEEPQFHCDKCSYKTHFKSSLISHIHRTKRGACKP